MPQGAAELAATPSLSHTAAPGRYTGLTELQIKPNPKNAKETAVAVQHEGERVLKVPAGRARRQLAGQGWGVGRMNGSPAASLLSSPAPAVPARAHQRWRALPCPALPRPAQALQPQDRVVLLDERGRDVSSEDLARLLAQVGPRRWGHAGGAIPCIDRAWAGRGSAWVGREPGGAVLAHPAAARQAPPALAPAVAAAAAMAVTEACCARCRHAAPQASDQSWPSLVFCIGGPFGHSPAVRARGNDTIRLSKMVLNHQASGPVFGARDAPCSGWPCCGIAVVPPGVAALFWGVQSGRAYEGCRPQLLLAPACSVSKLPGWATAPHFLLPACRWRTSSF